MATTAAAIRDAMVALVEALTPATHTQDAFRAHRERVDFRTWAEEHPADALRRFSIRFSRNAENAAVSDTRAEETGDTVEIVVAYAPSGRHGPDFLTALDDVLESDATKIHAAIGPPGYASFTAPATVMHQEPWTSEEAEGVVFLVLRYHVRWYRSLA